MLITISALTCFPQSVSTDIFWRPSSFNTFAATEMPWQSLLGNICWARKMCEAGAARDCFIGVTGMAQLLPWKRVCVSGSGLQEDQLSGLPYLPNRPICHTELPVQNLARCLHKRRSADEGLSGSWAAPSPHMFAQLAKWQERGLVLATEKQLGWGASYVTAGDADIQVLEAFNEIHEARGCSAHEGEPHSRCVVFPELWVRLLWPSNLLLLPLREVFVFK